MKKGTLIEIILANIGGLFFAIGLCLLCISDWNLFSFGIVLTLIGIFNLVAIIPLYKNLYKLEKMKWRKVFIRFVVFTIALIIGFGITQIISKQNIILGIVIWAVGLIISVLSYPTYQYYRIDKMKLLKTSMGVIGSVFLAIGLLMTFIRFGNLMIYGTIAGVIGVIFLLIFVFLHRKDHQDFYYVDLKFVMLIIVELIGGATTVFGILKVFNSGLNIIDSRALVVDLLSCSIGFIVCSIAIPTFIYIKSNDIEDKGIKIDLSSKEINYPVKNLIMLFFIYGFVGWLMEFISFGITSGHFANRGFLHLPILPIYGFGGVVVTMIFSKNQRYVFIKSALIFTVLEYITSYILEKIFKLRWWDYSNNPLNINGRVCLLNCLIFGLGGYIIVKFISPSLNIKLNSKKSKNTVIFNTLLVIITVVDFIYTLFNLNVGLGITQY